MYWANEERIGADAVAGALINFWENEHGLHAPAEATAAAPAEEWSGTLSCF